MHLAVTRGQKLTFIYGIDSYFRRRMETNSFLSFWISTTVQTTRYKHTVRPLYTHNKRVFRSILILHSSLAYLFIDSGVSFANQPLAKLATKHSEKDFDTTGYHPYTSKNSKLYEITLLNFFNITLSTTSGYKHVLCISSHLCIKTKSDTQENVSIKRWLRNTSLVPAPHRTGSVFSADVCDRVFLQKQRAELEVCTSTVFLKNVSH